MVRTFLKVVFACGVVYIAWNVGPVYLAYREFRTEVAGVTRVGCRGPERELVAVVAGLAERGAGSARGHQGTQGGDSHVSRGHLHRGAPFGPGGHLSVDRLDQRRRARRQAANCERRDRGGASLRMLPGVRQQAEDGLSFEGFRLPPAA